MFVTTIYMWMYIQIPIFTKETENGYSQVKEKARGIQEISLGNV